MLRVLYDTRSGIKALAYILFIILVLGLGIMFYFSFSVNYRKRKLYSKKIVEECLQNPTASKIIRRNGDQDI